MHDASEFPYEKLGDEPRPLGHMAQCTEQMDQHQVRSIAGRSTAQTNDVFSSVISCGVVTLHLSTASHAMRSCARRVALLHLS